MRKCLKLNCLLMFFVIIGTSCTDIQSKRLEKMQIFNQEHRDIPVVEIPAAKYMIDSMIDAESIPRKWSTNVYRNYLTKEEAIEEMEHLFLLLEGSYGLYYYYGKDQFDQAKVKLIDFILSSERVEVSKLLEMYRDKLNFIEDHHFEIGGIGLQEEQSIYYGKDVVFHKDENGYFLLSDNQRVLQIVSESGDITLQDHVKRVLNDDGTISYQIVVVGNKLEKLYLELADGTRKEVELGVHLSKYKVDYDVVSYEELNDIPILRIGEFQFPDTPAMLRLLQYGEKIRGKSIAVIDIRGNVGGSVFSVFQLMEKLVGENRTKGIEVRRTGLNKSALLTLTIDQMYQKAGFDISHTSYWYKQANAELIKNETILIVLMDQNTSSSGERLIDHLHCVENTLFVGVNSDGNVFGSGENPIYLLHSGALIRYGESMKLYDGRYFQEYRGFDPDIYYFGEEKLEELILKYLNS